MDIQLKRVYEPVDEGDGYRVLVDRLWPRGLSKDETELDEWLNEVAPSSDLRRWFHSDGASWAEFRSRYLAELKKHREQIRELANRARGDRVTLLYGSKDNVRNNAVVLKQYMKMLKKG